MILYNYGICSCIMSLYFVDFFVEAEKQNDLKVIEIQYQIRLFGFCYFFAQ